MLRENTVFARKIIDYYSDKGVDCSVVDEHLSLLVAISEGGRTHEFRFGNRAFAAFHHCRKFYMALEKELSRLRAGLPAPVAAARKSSKPRCRIREVAGEEVGAVR